MRKGRVPETNSQEKKKVIDMNEINEMFFHLEIVLFPGIRSVTYIQPAL